jgi:hypothetical protein
MTVNIALEPSLLRKRLRRDEHPISAEPVVGKDILELLSSAMYLDPRSIYREYVQNSADAIDEAFERGLFARDDLARIDITIDEQSRSIRLRDNGTGISSGDAERVLTSFGASAKRGKNARGFRGVGRLAAFGYAQVVAFKTKAAGEQVSTEVRWDCRRLKAALLDSSYQGDLRQIVRDVVSIAVQQEPSKHEHYFEVSLEKVLRLKNDALLNAEELERYLSEVAPAPFHREFAFASSIDAFLASYLEPCRFRIFINSSAEPIHRPHADSFAVSAVKSDAVTDIEFLTLPGLDGNTMAVGWILHHNYLGAIHHTDELRGMRARVGDIQVGTGDVFADAFSEPRFNSWTIGELHILDHKIVPNGRRDGFEQNAAFNDLYAHVTLLARRQSTRCRQSSARRNRMRSFDVREQRLHELLRILTQHGTSRPQALRTRREIAAAVAEMKRLAQSTVLSEDDRHTLARRLRKIESRFDGLKSLEGIEDPFAEVSPAQRAAYEQIIDLIYDCSPNKAAARILVDRIMTRLVARAIRAKRKGRARIGKTR